MYYFAFGSNMLTSRLQARVPSATALGRAFLQEHRLAFHKQGIDGSAKCDAFRTGRPDDCLPGVLFQIDPDELFRLDRAEGPGYERVLLAVELAHETALEA